MSGKYTVEILAHFEAIITHSFTLENMEDADSNIATVFENFEYEVQTEFSQQLIDIYLECEIKLSADNNYKFSGSLKRCFLFDEKDVDNDELIDGTFDNQLTDMKLAVNNCCDLSVYDITLEYFAWTDDEVIDKELD